MLPIPINPVQCIESQALPKAIPQYRVNSKPQASLEMFEKAK